MTVKTEVGYGTDTSEADEARGSDEPNGGVSSRAAASGIRRLEPTDGLFLRATHLDQIQAYARDLAELTATAGGSGVVYGYELDLQGEHLSSSPGLAFDPSGVALRAPTRLEVVLDGLDHTTGQVWVVEVVAAPPVLKGSEPLYSAVCADPCATGTTVRPWSESAVRLRLRPYGFDAPDTDPAFLISATASAYFERERRLPERQWPTATGLEPASPLAQRWSSPAPPGAPGKAGVPLGLLIRKPDSWYVDVWSARRDRMHTPPEAAWQQRLCRRPEAVFTAQVLQFQDQLADVGVAEDNPLTRHFVELPPAGFLPVPSHLSDKPLKPHLEAIFERSVRLIVAPCTADAAISAVELAHNLDRIPLSADLANYDRGEDGLVDPRPLVGVLVPFRDETEPFAATRDYPWVVFVRAPLPGALLPGRVPQYAESSGLWSDPSPPTPHATSSPTGADEAQATNGGSSEESPSQPVAVHVTSAPRLRSSYGGTVESLTAQAPLTEVVFGPGYRTVDGAEAVKRVRATAEDGGEPTGIDLVVGTADPLREPSLVAQARALAAECWPGDRRDVLGGIYAQHVEGPDVIVVMVRGR